MLDVEMNMEWMKLNDNRSIKQEYGTTSDKMFMKFTEMIKDDVNKNLHINLH